MQPLPRVCFCFLTLSGLTFGDQSGPPATRVTVKEDDDVVLPCSLGNSVNIELMLFDWKKEGTVPRKEVFMYDPDNLNTPYRGQDEQFRGRVSHFPGELKQGNASIRINKTRLEDKGTYTCLFPREQPSEKVFTLELVVGAASKPSVQILDQTNDWALLQCEVQRVSPKPEVLWKDSAGNIIPAQEPQVTERGGSYNVILQATVTKTDHYRCEATQKEINHQMFFETYVRLNGAASKPSVKVLEETNDWALLQCEVQRVSPKPEVLWKDSAGNIIPAQEPQVTERGGSYNVILQATVTKTDHYRCVATQKEINHQMFFETYVRLNVSEFPVGWVIAVAAAAAAVTFGLILAGAVVLLLVLKAKGYTCKKGSQEPTLSSIDSQHLNHDPKQPLNE